MNEEKVIAKLNSNFNKEIPNKYNKEQIKHNLHIIERSFL